MTHFEEFVRIFQLPPAMHQYVHFVVDDQEMELVVNLQHQAMTVDQVTELMGMSPAEAGEFLEKAFYRRIVNRETENGLTTYSAATFYERIEPLAMYENWGDVPAEARDAVIEWQLQEFIEKWLPALEQIRQDPDAFTDIPNSDVLLLAEALEQVEAATEHVVVPCDCRSITMACKRPLEVCIRLDEGARLTLEHGHGRRLSKEECRTIVIEAHRAGLMQTGWRAWREHGLFGFCNCCACDCYPIRAGMQLGLQKQWPRSHYVANRDLARCNHCRRCARICHFDAFYLDRATVEVNGRTKKAIQFDPEKCWGCGLCATACSQEAIMMIPLSEANPEEVT
jgi:NAD-dependent dihydropyrimidine dehydrogenase PreA subunit